MPNNFMAIDQGLPRFTGEESLEQRVKMLQDYQYQLAEQLRYALQHLDTRNMNMDAMDQWGGTLTEPLYASLTDEDGNMLSLAATAEGIAAQISSMSGKVTAVEVLAEGIITSLWDPNTGDITQLQATVDSICLSVSNGDTSSTIGLMVNGVLVQSETIQMDGVVWFTDLENSNTYTKIHGGNIITGTVEAATLAGEEILIKAVNADGEKVKAGEIILTEASSGDYAVELNSVEAMRFKACGGSLSLEDTTATRVVLSEDGVSVNYHLFPTSDEKFDLGRSNEGWNDIYAANCLASTSDRNRKNSISYDLSAYDKVFDGLMPASYKLNSGTSGRRHIGLVAQDVEIGLEESGLTGLDFAGLIKSPKKDKDGNVIAGEYVYGLRYGEFIGLLIDQVQKLKSRVAELERSKA